MLHNRPSSTNQYLPNWPQLNFTSWPCLWLRHYYWLQIKIIKIHTPYSYHYLSRQTTANHWSSDASSQEIKHTCLEHSRRTFGPYLNMPLLSLVSVSTVSYITDIILFFFPNKMKHPQKNYNNPSLNVKTVHCTATNCNWTRSKRFYKTNFRLFSYVLSWKSLCT